MCGDLRRRTSTRVDVRRRTWTDVDVRPLADVNVRCRAQCEWAFTVEALQGKMCRDSLRYQERVGHLEPRFQGEGVVPGEYFLVSTELDTFCCLTVQTALTCSRFDTIPACERQTDGRTDRQTDGIAIASTALAMRALRSAVTRMVGQPDR